MTGDRLTLRERFFGAFVDMATKRPKVVLAVIAVLMLVGLGFGTQIGLSTDRYSMVRKEDPYQARLDAFFDRFGYPDALVFVIRGADADARRNAAARIVDLGEAESAFHDRVLGRMDAEHMAEVLFLFQPEALEQLGDFVGDQPVAEVVERGLPGLMGAVDQQLSKALDGEVPEGGGGDGPDADEALSRLGDLAALLDDRLAGEDLRREVAHLASDGAKSAGEGDDPATGPPSAEALDFDMSGLDDEGFLVSRNGEFLIVAYLPEVIDSEMTSYEPLVDRAREISEEVEAEVEGVDVMLTGLPVMMLDEDRLVARGLLESGLGTGLGVFLILALAYRSIRQSIMALIPIGMGMAMALGATTIFFGELNPVTSGMFAVMLGLGIDFSVHLIGRYHECLRAADGDRVVAVRAALVQAGPGIVTGAITTALAFLSVATAEFTAYAELGIVVFLGLLIMLFCVLSMVPIFANWEFVPERAPPMLPGVVGLTRLVRKGTWPLLIVGVAVAAWGAFNFTNVQFNYRYLDFLPTSVESSAALEVIESDGAMNPMMGYLGAENIEAARDKAEALREKEAVGEVQSPSDLLPPLDENERLSQLRDGLEALGRTPDFEALADRKERSAKALSGSIEQVIDDLDELAFVLEQAGRSAKPAQSAKAQFVKLRARVDGLGDAAPERIGAVERELADLLERAWTTAENVASRGHYELADLPAVFRNRHGAIDGSGQVALFVIPKDLVWSEASARAFADAVTSVDAEAAGHAISMHVHNTMIIADFRRAAAIAAGIVLIVLFLDFRRVDDTLLAMVPVTVGWCWMVLVMALVPITLNLANIVVLPLVFGVGIDAGVHMVHRCRQSARKEGEGSTEGDDGKNVASLEDLLQGTGASVMLAAVTTMVGFAGLIVPDHGGMRSLGLAMVLGTGCCLVATIFVLPAVLVLIGRAK